MSTVFSVLKIMAEASYDSDISPPRGSRRRNALPDLLTDLDEEAVQRLRCLYRECMSRDGPAACEEDNREGDGSGVSGSILHPQPLDREDVVQSSRYTRRRNAVPDLSAQLGAVDLRNNICYHELDQDES